MTDHIKISQSIVKSVLQYICRNPLVCFSGGKDSSVMLYLIDSVADELGVHYDVLAGDPFPIEKNLVFIEKILQHYVKRVNRVLWMYKFVDDVGLKAYQEKDRDFELCCRINKIELLNRVVREYSYDCVFVAIRWDEHPARANESYIKLIENPKHFRIHPLLHWEWLDILAFLRDKPELFNPLYLEGYTSLGCKGCTEKTVDRVFKSIDEFIDFVLSEKPVERAGRRIDKEKAMARLRKLGYF